MKQIKKNSVGKVKDFGLNISPEFVIIDDFMPDTAVQDFMAIDKKKRQSKNAKRDSILNIIKKYPENAYVAVAGAHRLAIEEFFDLSMQITDSAINENPDNLIVGFYYARLLLANDNIDKAKAVFKKCVDRLQEESGRRSIYIAEFVEWTFTNACLFEQEKDFAGCERIIKLLEQTVPGHPCIEELHDMLDMMHLETIIDKYKHFVEKQEEAEKTPISIMHCKGCTCKEN